MRDEEVVSAAGETARPRRLVTAQGYRIGVAIGTIVALVGALGAPFKW